MSGPSFHTQGTVSPDAERNPVTHDRAAHFIVRVGTAAHSYGATAIRLELVLSELTRFFGMSGVFRSSPSEIVVALREEPGALQRVQIVPTATPDVQLDKLARIGELLRDLASERLSLVEASDRLHAIDHASPPWGALGLTLGYVAVAIGVTPLIGGSWADTFVAAAVSIVVFATVLLSLRLGAAGAALMPFSTALVAGVLAALAKLWLPDLNLVFVVLAAVAVILPGYTISLGVGELVAQHVVSGTSNLMRGLVCLVKQVAGGGLGIVFVSSLVTLPAGGPSVPVDPDWVAGMFPFFVLGLCLTFQMAPRDFLPATLVSLLAYFGVLAGKALFGAMAGNLIGTVVAVGAVQVWAHRTGRPTTILMIPVVVTLISGAIGFLGLAELWQGDVVPGLRDFTQMFIVALTVLAGVLIGLGLFRSDDALARAVKERERDAKSQNT